MASNYSGQTRRQETTVAPNLPSGISDAAEKTQTKALARARSALALRDDQLDKVVGGVAIMPMKPSAIFL